MKPSLSAAMARVTREPAQLGLGHDTQCAWSNGAMAAQLRREVECLEQLTTILPRRSHELNTSMQATGTKYFIIILLQFSRVSIRCSDLYAMCKGVLG